MCDYVGKNSFNRLSDLLFILAQAANEVSGTAETAVTYDL